MLVLAAEAWRGGEESWVETITMRWSIEVERCNQLPKIRQFSLHEPSELQRTQPRTLSTEHLAIIKHSVQYRLSAQAETPTSKTVSRYIDLNELF